MRLGIGKAMRIATKILAATLPVRGDRVMDRGFRFRVRSEIAPGGFAPGNARQTDSRRELVPPQAPPKARCAVSDLSQILSRDFLATSVEALEPVYRTERTAACSSSRQLFNPASGCPYCLSMP